MLRSTSSLKEFIELVPVCEQTASLDAVLAIFSFHQCDRLVVVTQQQKPLGLLHLQRLMPHLISQMQEESLPTRSTDLLSTYIVPYETGFSLSALLDPITCVSVDIPLREFWTQLETQPFNSNQNQLWAIVDAQEKFLGLLSNWRLLNYLAPTSQTSGNVQQLATTSPQSLLLEQAPQQTALKSLVQLLEQLPLPLSLQTQSGEVVSQNFTWRQQVGVSKILDSLAEKIATGLDFGQESFVLEDFFYLRCDLFDQTDGASCGVSELTNVSESNVMVSVPIAIKAQGMPASCTISTPESEPLKRGGDRVWQFAKIPLPEIESWGTPLWLVLATDVTEQQQVAKELSAKNADLVQLNRLKDEFLACISHELKTPLTAVLGLSSLLKEKVLGDLNERQARYAQLIHQSGRQLMTVVNDILDLTRMETGQLELTLDAVNIQTVCDRAYTQAQQLQPGKDTSPEEATSQTPFTLEIEPSLEMLVADDLRLRQMLVHLLSNALKFTEAGGEIGLKVTRWEGWIAFTVWDTGIGIPPQKQHLIFQKFQQLENPLTRRFEGTGLGLVLTQRLARLHGGDISFISKVGEGSQFTLLLPPCPPLEARGNEQFISFSPNSLVLIVEATPHYIEALTDQLTGLGYRVVIARSGTEAIEKARRLQPCAVLLNPLLPLLSGWDVLTLLKSDHQTRHIPVLVMATWAEKEQAYQNQADGFLSLPIEGTALQESLNQLTPQKSNASSSLMILRLTPFSCTNPEKMAATCLKLEEVSNQEEVSFLSPNYELNYRVLEADDLEQAELLARVWHPHVVLLESCDLEDPLTYLRQLTQHTHLASLPLVTLDHQTTAAANQVTELSVFPCLETTQSHKTAALLQAIQVAAGLCWKPNILVVDITQLSDLSVPVYARSTSLEGRTLSSSEPYSTFAYGQGNMTLEEESPDEVQEIRASKSYTTHSQIEWLQALIQYLQAAGFTSLLSSSWTEVYRHLQHQNVDLLVIYIGEIYAEQQLVQGLTFLAQQSEKPPILVLDHRLEPSLNDEAVDDGEKILKTIASQIIRGSSQSMAELLNVINQMLVPKNC